MRALALILLVASVAVAQEPAPPTGFQRVKLNGHTFTIQDGFSIELAAKAPQVDRPVTMALDDQGRLYVADSSGDNSRPTDQIKNPTHRVVRLESSKKDGVYDKSVVFADKLSFLQGTMWHKGSLYVAAPPKVLKLTDTDGDGVADKRETWFDGGTLTGCANDLHGPYLGPDGLFYWTKGAFAKQDVPLKNGKVLTTRAAHVFRAKPDASDIEVVMTGGMDNPVGVAFLPTGETFVSCTFVQHPAGGKRDAILHCAYGAVYGKDHDPIREQPWTDTQFAEPMTHLGPAAPAGLHAYRSKHFGTDFAGNLFCSQFNMAKVSRHVLKPKGATFETVDSDFVTSDVKDFHPTDVIEDADGSLLIADTGGWYKLCCPSSVLEKKDVLGAIYRVRKVNGAKAAPVSWPPLRAPKPVTLASVNPHDRLRAVENVGRTQAKGRLQALADLLSNDDRDPVLTRAVVQAMTDLGDAKELRRLRDTSGAAAVARAALLALAALPKALEFADLVPFLSVQNAALRDAAWFIAERRADWSALLALYFDKRLAGDLDKPDATDWDARLGRFAGRAEVQKLLVRHAKNPVVLKALAEAKPKDLVPEWLPVLADALAPADPLRDSMRPVESVRVALSLLKPFPTDAKQYDTVRKRLLDVSTHVPYPADLRLQAAALSVGELTPDLFAFCLFSIAAEKPGTVRAAAADILTRAKLTDKQLLALADALPKASPTEIGRLVEAFGKSTEAAVGTALVTALKQPKVRAVVRTESLKPLLAKYAAPVPTEAAAVYELLEADRKDQKKKLDELKTQMKAGDARRGHLIFSSAKASCAACHKIAYVGGAIGPDLTKIGGIRTETDLLEAIVFPSASFVRSYEPVQVTTLDGRTFNGILKADAPAEVVLTLSATEEVRIARKDIDAMKPGTVSVMPAGLDQQLTPQDLADLIAFLKDRK